ncbi:MAG: hypothetical protein ACYC61_20020 [Isosphaeraceae bacterium]
MERQKLEQLDRMRVFSVQRPISLQPADDGIAHAPRALAEAIGVGLVFPLILGNFTGAFRRVLQHGNHPLVVHV